MNTPSRQGEHRHSSLVRRLIVRAATVALGTLVALLLVEIGIRFFVDEGDIFKTSDKVVYFKYRGGQEGLRVSQADPSLRVPVRINSHGYRGSEWPTDEGDEIAFLGDSFTVAMEVPYEQCFVSLVEQELQRRGAPSACLNLGVDGSGTGLALLQFEREVVQRHPRAVVLQFFVGNDFSDNVAELSWKGYYPHWVVEDGQLQRIEPQSDVPWLLEVCRYSRAAAFMYRRYRDLARVHAAPEASKEDGLLRPHDFPAWSRAYDVTLALLDRCVEIAAAHDIPFVLVIVPTSDQVGRCIASADKCPDLLHPQRMIAGHLADRAEIIDLLPLLVAEGRRRQDAQWYFFPKDGHFSPAGHAFVAEILAPVLAEIVQIGADSDEE